MFIHFKAQNCARVPQSTPSLLRLVSLVRAFFCQQSTLVVARDSAICARSTLRCLAGLSLLWSGCAQISVEPLQALHAYNDSNCGPASEQNRRAAASLAQASMVARVPNAAGTTTISINRQTNQATLLSTGFAADDDSSLKWPAGSATIHPPAQPHSQTTAAMSASFDVATHCNDKLKGMYDGDCQNGERDGRGVMMYPDGSSYDGGWSYDKKHGHGVTKYADGGTYEGEWKYDTIHGYGMYTGTDGGATYEGEWKDDTIHGHGVVTYPNGATYEGEFENGNKHGRGVDTFADGVIHECEYKNGKRHGRVVYTNAEGNAYDDEWKTDGCGVRTWWRDDKSTGRGRLTVPIHYGSAFAVVSSCFLLVMLASCLIGYGIGGPCGWFSSRGKTQHEKVRQPNVSAEEVRKTEACEKQKTQRKARRTIQAKKHSGSDAEAKARCRQEAEFKAADEANAQKARKKSEVNAKKRREAEIARRQAEIEAHGAAVSKSGPSFEEPDAAAKRGGNNGDDEARLPERSEVPRQFECPIR